MEKLIDLHTHTSYSDGIDTPKDLLIKAKEILKVIAITDHDTIEGIKELSKEEMNDSKLIVIPGIEVTGKVEVGQLHILGLNIDSNNVNLNKKTKLLKELSILKVKKMISYLRNKYRIFFEDDELESLYNSVGNIGRPHISHLLMKHGHAKTNKESFEKYLIEAYEEVRELELELHPKEAIDMIIKASGVPILAHPYSLEKDLTELRVYIRQLIDYGLEGIEVYHSNHSLEYMNELNKISKDYQLLVSGGSDYHGSLIKPDIELGIGKNNIHIKELSLLDKIRR